MSRKSVITLQDACAIRSAVLDWTGEVVRGSGVSGGVEYSCWNVTGDGWRARVTNQLDLNRCGPPVSTEQEAWLDNASSYERLELFIDRVNPDVPMLEIKYCIEGGEEQLIGYRGGRWERLFKTGTFKGLPVGLARALSLAALSAT